MPFTDDDREKLTEMHTLVLQNLVPTSKDHEIRLRHLEKTVSRRLALLALSVLSWDGLERIS